MRFRRRIVQVILAWPLATALWPAPAGAVIVGRIVQAGYRDQSGTCFRRGQWCPVRVELGLRGQSEFTGSLRIEQPDSDADICFSETPVTLSGEGARRVFTLFALPNPTDSGTISVRVLDEAGAAVAVEAPGGTMTTRLRESGALRPIGDDTLLVVDISAAPLSSLAQGIAATQGRFRQPIHYATLSAVDLPNHWLGLEAVDVIVWDAADPGALDGRQLDALLDWVRFGGRLIVAAGRTAGAVVQSRLGPLLPVEVGPLRTVEFLPYVQLRMFGLGEDEPWPDGLQYCQTTLRPTGGARVIVGEDERNTIPFLTQAPLGRGEIRYLPAALEQLLRLSGVAREGVEKARAQSVWLAHLLPVRSVTDTESQLRAFPTPLNLFAHVRNTVDFRARGGAFMAVALLFIVSYVLIATWAVWTWLGRRGWDQHNWLLFGVTALGASLLSVVAVRAIKGIGADLHQLSVVDAETGTTAARAMACYGLKTASHTTLDLCLPPSPDRTGPDEVQRCLLRPMPPGEDQSRVGFLSPASYRARPTRAMLEDVLFRATLKQFQGYWEGEMQGMFDGRIVEASGTITDDSWVENRLGTDLVGCRLLVARLNPDVARIGAAIQVYWLGEIPDGARLEALGKVIRERESTAPLQAANPNEPRRATIDDEHPAWIAELEPGFSQRFARGDPQRIDPASYDKALLLLSTRGEFVPPPPAGGMINTQLQLVSTNLRSLDCSERLTRQMALLVGFSDDAGPAPLCVRPGGDDDGRFRLLKPTEARTMYRIWIPMGPSGAK